MSTLQFARLMYGKSACEVTPSKLVPLPTEFDFADAEACARKIFAIMSYASGGFLLSNCRMHIIAERQTANLVANGAHIFYAPTDRPKLTVEEAIALEQLKVTTSLGNVVLGSGFGNGWERARWYGDADGSTPGIWR